MSANDKGIIEKINGITSYEEIIKKSNVVRLMTLRKLLLCYYVTLQSFNKPEEGIKMCYRIKDIQSMLSCGKREAYDYLNTILLIARLETLTEQAVTKSLMVAAKLKQDYCQTG